MKSFTREEIDSARTHFRRQGFHEVEATVGDREFRYFVVPQSLEPNLPNFAMRITGKSDEGYVLGISDNVNPKHRPFAVVHEYIEFIEFGIDTPHRCISALEEELRLLPEDIKPDYLPMRAEFFRSLALYCSRHPAHYTQDDVKQFKRNADRLEQLLG